MVQVETISESEDERYKNFPILSSRSYEQPSQPPNHTAAAARDTRAAQGLVSSSTLRDVGQAPVSQVWAATLIVNSLLIAVQAWLQHTLVPEAFAAEPMISWAAYWMSTLPIAYFSLRYGKKRELSWVWLFLALLIGSRLLSTLHASQACRKGDCRLSSLKTVPRLAALFTLLALQIGWAKLALGLILLGLYYLYLY